MASALRVTMSPSEAADIIQLADRATLAGVELPSRLPEMLAQLSLCSGEVRRKQSAKRAEREYVKQIEADRRDRERYFMVGEHFSVIATRADYADVTSDPDSRVWVDVAFQGFLSKPIPDQCEIRREVWLVRVVQLLDRSAKASVGVDCTETSDDSEIRQVADRLIEAWKARPLPSVFGDNYECAP